MKRTQLLYGAIAAICLAFVAQADFVTLLALVTLSSQPKTSVNFIVPQVAVAPTGESVTAGCEVNLQGGTTLKLNFRNSAGQMVAGPIVVSSPGVMNLMQVAAGPTAFMLVWDATGAPGDPTAGGIYFNTYTFTGTLITSQPIQANTLTNLNEYRPSAAGYPNGANGTNFAVIWARRTVGSTSTQGVYLRRFTSTGAPIDSAEIRVDNPSVTAGLADSVGCAAWPDGRVACTWHDGPINAALTPNVDGSGCSVLGRIFNANMTPRTGQFVVNSITALSQFEPHVAVDGFTTCAFGWCGDTTATTIDAYLRRFNDVGQALDPVDINVTPADPLGQYLMGLAMDSAGDIAVSWQDTATSGFGGSRAGFARYAPGSPTPVEAGLLDAAGGSQTQQYPRLAMDQWGNVRALWFADTGTLALLNERVLQRNMITFSPPSTGSGGQFGCLLDAPAAGGGFYQLACAFTPSLTGVGDRAIRLSLDDLFTISVTNVAPTTFIAMSGTLNANGLTTAPLINVPVYPAISGATIWFAFAVLAPGYPANVKLISETTPCTFQ